MGSRFSIGHGHVADALDGEGIVETAVIAQDATVAMGGVLAEADIDDDEEVGEGAAQQPDGADDRSLGVVGVSTQGVFGAGGQGHAEQNDGAETLGDERGEVGDQAVEAAAVDVGQRGNQCLLVGLVGDEEWIDEHGLHHRSAMHRRGWRERHRAYLGQLALGLPCARQWMAVAAVQLALDVAGNAHARGGGAGV